MRNTYNRILTGLLISVSVSGIIYLGYSTFSSRSTKDQKNPYEYDITPFQETDPVLIDYTETKKIKIDLKELYGIGLDSNDLIYITGDSCLIRLDENDIPQLKVDLGQPARCLTIDKNNNTYLGMKNHLQIYDRNGKKLTEWRNFEDNTLITSIAVTSEHVFVADAINRVVLKIDKSGNLLGRIGEKDEAREIPGFVVPSPYFDLAIDPEGFLWVVNPGRHSLENYTTNGDLRSFWGKYSMKINGFCGCCNPTHIAILSDGSFVTSEKGIVRVRVHNRVGNLVSVVAAPDQFSEGTVGLDLAVDSIDQIYVLDPKLRVVRIYSKNTDVNYADRYINFK